HEKFLFRIFEVLIVTSYPLLLISPTLAKYSEKPEEPGIGCSNNTSDVYLLYTSAVNDSLLLNAAKSKPILVCVVFSQRNSSFPNWLGATPYAEEPNASAVVAPPLHNPRAAKLLIPA